jgi:methyltransferase (TIGR00027 family)
MDTDSHSITAVLVAVGRAYHSPQSGAKIFEDNLARLLTSDAECTTYENICVDVLQKLSPALAASCPDRAAFVYQAQRVGAGTVPVLVRARYVEETLLASLEHGVRQYVIIGAGLDTFAFRRPELADRLQIFEIDHPRSQAFKRERLMRAGLTSPPHLHFAAADLEVESIEAALGRTPYDPNVPTFFAWPGVTLYLTRQAISETLRSIAKIAPAGSELVFDYIEPGAFGSDAPPRIQLLLQRVKQLGEAAKSGLDPVTLESELATIGFDVIEDLDPDQIQRRFLNASDGFRAAEYFHLIRATRRPV